MRLDQAEKAIREAVASQQTFVVFGRCTVRYQGRSASTLAEGERVLLVKQDRSVLLHRPFGYEPVNWQPPGCTIEVTATDAELVFLAARTRPHERLVVSFSDITGIQAHRLQDEAEFSMYATEEEMKRAVVLHPQLIEEGFKPLEEERRAGPSGFIDVFGVDAKGNLTVVELKRRAADRADIHQVENYAKKVHKELGRKVRAVIAAPSLKKAAVPLLKAHGVEFRCLTPRTCRELLGKHEGLDRFSRQVP